MRKITRTISGVTPVAVMTEALNCPGHCVYCPTFPETPRSYTPRSPAVQRGRQCDFDAARQVKLRLKMMTDMGHPTDKIELIVMGGTFLAYPEDYQYRFIKGCYDALNDEESASLAEAKQLNEQASHRCTGLCIETRPDWCKQEQINRMLDFGATRVELGVQMLDDEIYRLVRRGHTVEDVVQATRLLREHAFKVHYHWMPGLPGSTPEKDLALSEQLFSDARFRPDGLKIYPTMVVEGTELEKWYRDGRYQPYSDETMIALVASIKAIVPKYVRISRVLRDIPPQFITGGVKESLRNVVKQRMKQLGTECHCIRCREYGHRVLAGREPGEPFRVNLQGEPRLVRTDYEASEGREVFLSFEDDEETLFGLLRMRIQSKPFGFASSSVNSAEGLEQESNNKVALIRELHIYGPEVPMKQQNPAAAQHKGLGKALLTEAERIAREEFRSPQIAVLSGVGARDYYRAESGYTLQEDYMVKSLL